MTYILHAGDLRNNPSVADRYQSKLLQAAVQVCIFLYLMVACHYVSLQGRRLNATYTGTFPFGLDPIWKLRLPTSPNQMSPIKLEYFSCLKSVCACFGSG